MKQQRNYTKEQLVDLILLQQILEEYSDVKTGWVTSDHYRHGDNPVLYINVNDLWWWGSADAEDVEPEDAKILTQRLKELRHLHYEATPTDVVGLACGEIEPLILARTEVQYLCTQMYYTCLAFISVRRGMDPENLFKCFKRGDDNKWRNIKEFPEYLELFNREKTWWLEHGNLSVRPS
jgi:hypothetical protein